MIFNIKSVVAALFATSAIVAAAPNDYYVPPPKYPTCTTVYVTKVTDVHVPFTSTIVKTSFKPSTTLIVTHKPTTFTTEVPFTTTKHTVTEVEKTITTTTVKTVHVTTEVPVTKTKHSVVTSNVDVTKTSVTEVPHPFTKLSTGVTEVHTTKVHPSTSCKNYY